MATPSIEIRLFGPLHVTIAGTPMPRVRTRSVEWLLALLVLKHDNDVERSWLAGTLWPESEESQALQNLRTALVSLRKALGPESGRIQSPTRDLLRFDLAGADVDVPFFDRAIKSGDEESLRRAVDCCTGALLEGCYAEWVHLEREVRARQCVEALGSLADGAQTRGDQAEAIRLLRRSESLDPLRDSTIRRLMTALEATGDFGAAVEAYCRFRNRLHDELSTAPDTATTQLFQEMRSRARASGFKGQSADTSQRLSQEQNPIDADPRQRPPHAISPIIGRDQDLEDIRERLTKNRLVTLVGAGGVGKTRLAIEFASLANADMEGGAVWVEFAPLPEGALLLSTIAYALGFRQEDAATAASLQNNLVSKLSETPTLLVLDNCEHLLDHAAATTELFLSRCPELRILATSRQRLGLTDEVIWRVPSLPIPDPDRLMGPQGGSADEAMKYPAFQLFVERATMGNPGFNVLDEEDVVAIARICQKLDGIPLAIELAAARARVLSVRQIASRIDDRFRLLTGGAKTALPRQQTLRALIDWSYDLLSEHEKALFRRLSVFAGGWTLEAAEDVCGGMWLDGGEIGESIHPNTQTPIQDTLDLLTGLIDKSLVGVESSGVSVRYRLLETVRQYSHDRLLESGESREYRDKHLLHYLSFAEIAAPQLRGPEQQEWLKKLDRDYDNMRQALAHTFDEPAQIEVGLRIAGYLSHFWLIRGRFLEGRECYAALLNHEDAIVRTAARANALNGAGALAHFQGDLVAAIGLYEESLAIRRELGERKVVAGSLHNLGMISFATGDFAKSKSLFDEALQINRELGNRLWEAANLNGLGTVAQKQCDYTTARSLLEASLEMTRQLGDQGSVSIILHNLGDIAFIQCDYASAVTLYRESETICRAMGEKLRVARVLQSLALTAYATGDLSTAKPLLEEAFQLGREVGARLSDRDVHDAMGRISQDQGDYASARLLYEQSLAIGEEIADRSAIASSLYSMAGLAREMGEYSDARSLLFRSLTIRRELGDRRGITELLEAFAGLSASDGDLSRATMVWGAAKNIRDEIGAPLPFNQRSPYEAQIAAARVALGNDGFDSAWNEGREMSMEQAVRLALAVS